MDKKLQIFWFVSFADSMLLHVATMPETLTVNQVIFLIEESYSINISFAILADISPEFSYFFLLELDA